MKVLIQIVLLIVFSAPVNAGIIVKKIGDLETTLNENSGLEYYKNKYLIALNDSGDDPSIYIINNQGIIIKTIDVLGAKNNDWEDITSSLDGRLFIGDIGNNLNTRKECQIYILNKEFLTFENNKATAEKIIFTYEDQKGFPPNKKELYYDAEAMFWMKDSIYIITKCRSEPFTGRSFVYVLPDKPGTYKARKIGEIPFCSLGWMFCSVTAADYHPQSKTLAILLYGKLVLINNFKGNKFWDGEIKTYNIPGIKQRESITFIDSKNWYMSDEKTRGLGGGNLYKVALK